MASKGLKLPKFSAARAQGGGLRTPAPPDPAPLPERTSPSAPAASRRPAQCRFLREGCGVARGRLTAAPVTSVSVQISSMTYRQPTYDARPTLARLQHVCIHCFSNRTGGTAHAPVLYRHTHAAIDVNLGHEGDRSGAASSASNKSIASTTPGHALAGRRCSSSLGVERYICRQTRTRHTDRSCAGTPCHMSRVSLPHRGCAPLRAGGALCTFRRRQQNGGERGLVLSHKNRTY